MQICLDMRTGAGCGTENPNDAHLCSKCGKALRFAVALHDANTHVGRYRVRRVMGYGAYGAVYEAKESSSALFDEKAASLQSSVMRAAPTTKEYLEPYLIIEIPDRWSYITTDKAKEVIIVVTAQRRIYQWRVVDGQLLATQTLPGRGWLTAVAISGDKQKIAAASRGVVRVWELEKMTLLFEFHQHPGKIQHLAFRPDDEVLAGTVSGKLWFWQMGDGQLLRPMQHFSRLGEESFCGILMDTQYGFNDDGKFYLLSFYAKAEHREEVKIAARNEFGATNGRVISWTIGDIEIEVKLGGLIVTMTYQKFAQK